MERILPYRIARTKKLKEVKCPQCKKKIAPKHFLGHLEKCIGAEAAGAAEASGE